MPLTLDQLPDDIAALKALLVAQDAELAAAKNGLVITQLMIEKLKAKIAKLLHHAYQRARKENDETLRRFDSAIKSLRRGDHYVLVMWDMRPGLHGPYLIGLLVGECASLSSTV